MTKEKHCLKCMDILESPFEYVHDWLDEFADGSYAHRAHRHHVEGIEKVRKRWGLRAALAARIHIEQDWGYVPRRCEYLHLETMKMEYYKYRGFQYSRDGNC